MKMMIIVCVSVQDVENDDEDDDYSVSVQDVENDDEDDDYSVCICAGCGE